jgi:hypothetical protein
MQNEMTEEKMYQLAVDLADAVVSKKWSEVKGLLDLFCRQTPIQRVDALFKGDWEKTFVFFKLFVKSGLDVAGEETHAGKFFEKIVRRLIYDAPETEKKILNECLSETFPELTPCGFDLSGPVYDIKDLAKSLGVPTEDLIQKADRLGMNPIEVSFQEPGETIH